MIGDGPLGGFRVPGRKVEEIRLSAHRVRKVLGVGDDTQSIDMPRLLDRLSVEYGISYDVLDVYEMPNVEAWWDPETVTMNLRCDVFDKVCARDPRARFTVLHELGHGLLAHRRTMNRAEAGTRPVKIYEDSEWQANQFAAEFLMPLAAIQRLGLKTAAAIGEHFKVSPRCAGRRVDQLSKRGELPC